MEKHVCPLCRKESDCLNPNCIDHTLKFEWCSPCRIKVIRYLTGGNVIPII